MIQTTVQGAPVDLTLVTTWPQAVVAIALVLAAMVWPGVASWLNSRSAKEAAHGAREAIEHEARPNSGGSMKDSLNRIESTLTVVLGNQEAHDARLDALEEAAAKRRRRNRWSR